VDLEVQYCVGVADEERKQPQRLLLCVDLEFDFSAAAMSDRLTRTIDYFEVCQWLLNFGERRNWRLIERLATNLADELLGQYSPQAVTVEVKKTAIPQARYISAIVTRERG
jgi:dihydroneopterin aldolase